jgi:hypothetical protein
MSKGNSEVVSLRVIPTRPAPPQGSWESGIRRRRPEIVKCSWMFPAAQPIG